MSSLDDARKRAEGIWDEAGAANAHTAIHIAVQLERIAEALETIALTDPPAPLKPPYDDHSQAHIERALAEADELNAAEREYRAASANLSTPHFTSLDSSEAVLRFRLASDRLAEARNPQETKP